MSDPRRLTVEELDKVETWAETLDNNRRRVVMALVAEAREHRRLKARLHDDLINELA